MNWFYYDKTYVYKLNVVLSVKLKKNNEIACTYNIKLSAI